MAVKQIKLSPSRLNTFLACKRCFWMAMHGKAVPGGFPMALLNVMDGIQKRYYDKYRSKGLPPPFIQYFMKIIACENALTPKPPKRHTIWLIV